MHYEAQLSKQGYSYEEVVKLQTHYDNEIARLRKLEREAAREQRIAESLVKELHEEEQKFEIKQEQEKKLDTLKRLREVINDEVINADFHCENGNVVYD